MSQTTGQPEPEQNTADDLEPFQGRYDWDEAARQNPGEPRFEVPEAERNRVHG